MSASFTAVDVPMFVRPMMVARGQILQATIDGKPFLLFHSQTELDVFLDGLREKGIAEVEP